ncbi:MAG: hypothetical protein FVQ80_12485 [Planctomycetes bacterium]|nr:hypothetical protein [Planctomycetota bacterium]
MKIKSRLNTFLLFALLSAMIFLQIASMMQSDRLYVLLNRFIAGDTDSTSTASTKTDLPMPEYIGDEGDWLVWGFRVEPRTLNQFSAENDIYSRWITVPYIFEPLLVYDYEDLTMKPHLARSYEVSDDHLEITFTLRDDIYFSDGVPVTADDVVFTYNTAVDPKVDAANVAVLYVDVDRVVKVSDRVVKFIMKRPNFKAIENVCFWDFGIMPKHIYQYEDAREFNIRVSNPVGSGPFVFEKWESGIEVVLRRNENYWGHKPKLKKIVYRFITNTVAAIQALRSHDVDMVIPEPDQFAELFKDGRFGKDFYTLSYWNPGVPFFYIGWNQEKVFFKDKLVRRAMTHIINRKEIVNRLIKGHGAEISGPYFIKGPYNDIDIKPWPYDLEEARRLLDKTGWIDTDGDGVRDKDGIPFRFKYMYSADNVLYQRMAKLFKDNAAKVGIDVIPEPVEWSIVIARIINHDFDAISMGWGGDVLEDFYQIFHSSQSKNRGSNYVSFENPQADRLLEQIRTTFDINERIELCHQLHRILHDEQPYTFLFTRPTFRLVDRRFKNVNIYTLGPKYWQWYVPKDEQRYK